MWASACARGAASTCLRSIPPLGDIKRFLSFSLLVPTAVSVISLVRVLWCFPLVTAESDDDGAGGGYSIG